jgi:hypothetical protein
MRFWAWFLFMVSLYLRGLSHLNLTSKKDSQNALESLAYRLNRSPAAR